MPRCLCGTCPLCKTRLRSRQRHENKQRELLKLEADQFPLFQAELRSANFWLDQLRHRTQPLRELWGN